MENLTLDKEVEEETELCDWCEEQGHFYIEDFLYVKIIWPMQNIWCG